MAVSAPPSAPPSAPSSAPPSYPFPPLAQWGSTPIPDPTKLTQDAVDRLEKSLASYIDGALAVRDERLRAIDLAHDLTHEDQQRVPGIIDEKVSHAREVATIQFAAQDRLHAVEIAHLREVDDIRFQAAERLAARESELNALALAAAFAAQKEASAKEAEYTRIASTKESQTTSDALEKLGQLFSSQFGGLADKVDDIKDRVVQVEANKVGANEQRTEGRQSNAAVWAAVAAVTGLIMFIIVVGGVLIAASK
jgi:hypothetical protein